MNADISPQDAIERVRERGDIIRWEDSNSGRTFVVRRPDDEEIISRYRVERHYNGNITPHCMINPMSLLNVLDSQDYTVVRKDEIRR